MEIFIVATMTDFRAINTVGYSSCDVREEEEIERVKARKRAGPMYHGQGCTSRSLGDIFYN